MEIITPRREDLAIINDVYYNTLPRFATGFHLTGYWRIFLIKVKPRSHTGYHCEVKKNINVDLNCLSDYGLYFVFKLLLCISNLYLPILKA